MVGHDPRYMLSEQRESKESRSVGPNPDPGTLNPEPYPPRYRHNRHTPRIQHPYNVRVTGPQAARG
jgi:hypothetical protein